MNKFKKGDIVGRKSYNKDVIFEIIRIIKIKKNTKVYILKGITKRIEADCSEEDLELIDKRTISIYEEKVNNEIYRRIAKYINNIYLENKSSSSNVEFKKIFSKSVNKRAINRIYTGKILHLDGDRKYSEKSFKYYKEMGLNAVVKNIPENKQPKMVFDLLDKYKPDILIITGHDGMIKKGKSFSDIYNYRNSRFFINAVNIARMWSFKNKIDLAIFAGACQSYYEAIISAGANFASSPKRIMIDFIDPLIVAEKIATTANTKYLTILDIEKELKNGRDGVDGIGTYGKKSSVTKM